MDVEEENYLYIIEKNNAKNVCEACKDMLKLWLQKKPEATWSKLINAVRAPGIEMNDVACKIEEMLLDSSEGKDMIYYMFSVIGVVTLCTNTEKVL